MNSANTKKAFLLLMAGKHESEINGEVLAVVKGQGFTIVQVVTSPS
jgi:hypothetical protein